MKDVEKIKNRTFKNRNILVIVFEIVIILLGIIGITYATSKVLNNNTKTIITAGKYNLDYVGENNITFSALEPMSSDKVNINTKDNVLRLEFSLRGTSTNKDDKLIYDVMLEDMKIDNSLLTEYTKWNLYKNGKLLSSGNLSPLFDGNVLGDTMHLTTIQEDLPKYNEKYDKYVLIFWIDESCNELGKCELVDQSNIINSKMSMKVSVALYGGKKKKYNRIPNYDTSYANKPILSSKMIPVIYKSGLWITVDKNNSDKNNLWYDYNNQKWANAVIVKNNENKYQNANVVVDNNDILAHYVWIPRFRYKLWNVEEKVQDSYNAFDNGIDIIFENKLNSTNKQDTYKNSEYITHPAFLNNLTGFWISKYEISKQDDNYYSIPSKEGYYNDTIDNLQKITNNLAIDYLLGDEIESHMVNNLEWGAVLYLSHSKYGVCVSDGCIKIENNKTNISGNNKQDTTTRNVYGVYDMSGGLSEYVLGNYKIGSATNEVILSNGDTWYQGHSLISDRDYLIRGGKDKELFYFGDIGMGIGEIGTRSVLTKK